MTPMPEKSENCTNCPPTAYYEELCHVFDRVHSHPLHCSRACLADSGSERAATQPKEGRCAGTVQANALPALAM